MIFAYMTNEKIISSSYPSVRFPASFFVFSNHWIRFNLKTCFPGFFPKNISKYFSRLVYKCTDLSFQSNRFDFYLHPDFLLNKSLFFEDSQKGTIYTSFLVRAVYFDCGYVNSKKCIIQHIGGADICLEIPTKSARSIFPEVLQTFYQSPIFSFII